MYGFIVIFAPLLCFLGAYYVGTHPDPNHPVGSIITAIALFALGVSIVVSALDRWIHK